MSSAASLVILYTEASILASYVIISVRRCAFANCAVASGHLTVCSMVAQCTKRVNFKSKKAECKIVIIKDLLHVETFK